MLPFQIGTSYSCTLLVQQKLTHATRLFLTKMHFFKCLWLFPNDSIWGRSSKRLRKAHRAAFHPGQNQVSPRRDASRRVCGPWDREAAARSAPLLAPARGGDRRGPSPPRDWHLPGRPLPALTAPGDGGDAGGGLASGLLGRGAALDPLPAAGRVAQQRGGRGGTGRHGRQGEQEEGAEQLYQLRAAGRQRVRNPGGRAREGLSPPAGRGDTRRSGVHGWGCCGRSRGPLESGTWASRPGGR